MSPPTTTDTAALETVHDVIEHAAASKVFGVPVSQDGITVLPVARVSGGGGGGGGTGGTGASEGRPDATGSGSGGGVGLTAKPLGVFVIRNGTVAWRPAIDLNKVILGGQIVAVVALLVLRAFIRTRIASR